MDEKVMVRRRNFFDEIDDMFKRLRRLLDEQEEFYSLEKFENSFSSTYSITLTYDDYGRPIVRVSAQGDVDRREMERYIKERYPNAKIIWEDEGSGESHVKPVEEDNHIREISVQEQDVLKQARRLRENDIVELGSKKSRIYEVRVDEDKSKDGRKWYDIRVD